MKAHTQQQSQHLERHDQELLQLRAQLFTAQRQAQEQDHRLAQRDQELLQLQRDPLLEAQEKAQQLLEAQRLAQEEANQRAIRLDLEQIQHKTRK